MTDAQEKSRDLAMKSILGHGKRTTKQSQAESLMRHAIWVYECIETERRRKAREEAQ